MADVYVNGELYSPDQAVLSTFDHGVVVGDGAFETILLRHGRPFALARHLARLNRTLAGLMINSVDTDEIARAVERVIASCTYAEGRIRVTVTAGTGPLGSGRYDCGPSIIVATSEGMPIHQHALVATVPWPRNERGALAGLKTISYAENAVALAFAETKGADEAIFANIAGDLCEGSGSNIFVVRDGTLCTPTLSAGCLAGITRDLVLEFCGGVEQNLPLTDFHPNGVSEAFLTSAIRGVQPISVIDDNAFATVPGPQTLLMMERYNDLRDREIEP